MKKREAGRGGIVDSQTLVEDFQLVSDRIYPQTHGYIKGYRIFLCPGPSPPKESPGSGRGRVGGMEPGEGPGGF